MVGASVFLLHFDLNGFRFCLLSLLNLEIQHAILERSANFSFIDIVRQRKATGEAPVVSLDSMEPFPFLFFFLFSLSLNRQDTIVYSNFDILLIDLGNLRLDLECFVSLSDVHPGSPVACCDVLLASNAILFHRSRVAAIRPAPSLQSLEDPGELDMSRRVLSVSAMSTRGAQSPVAMTSWLPALGCPTALV